MQRIPAVFFGTRDFAAAILEGLLTLPFLSVDLVITQPDRLAGRKQTLSKPPVKIVAEHCNIATQQPATLKNYKISSISYQLGIAAQYGLIVPKRVLDAFPSGILNAHPSLLPKYRGASPIQTAIMNGDAETGATIMRLDEGLDTGPILLQKKYPIGPDETYRDLEEKLATLSVEALTETIPPYIAGSLVPQPQNESNATMTKPLTRNDGRIDWNKSARDIYNQYRALAPWPGIWTTWNGRRLKLLAMRPATASLPPGKTEIRSGRLLAGAGDKSVEILKLQPENGKAMEAGAFIAGHGKITDALLI